MSELSVVYGEMEGMKTKRNDLIVERAAGPSARDFVKKRARPTKQSYLSMMMTPAHELTHPFYHVRFKP